MGCPIRCVYVRKDVMPVLRIVVDGWMGGCNALFKDCCGWMGGCNALFKDCCG